MSILMFDSRIQVLAVDDEVDFSALTKNFLERSMVMEVKTARSVREAMAELAKKRYDEIVSDYQMPEEDGIQFLKPLRAAGDGTPFIILTDKGEEEVNIEAFNNGPDFCLEKRCELGQGARFIITAPICGLRESKKVGR